MKKVGLTLSFSLLVVLLLLNSCKKEEEPSLITSDITELTQSSATCGGVILSSGDSQITAKGVCWSTKKNPAIIDHKTTDGIGSDSFTSKLTDLDPATLYYARAYAINSDGIGYGTEIEFTTLGETPGVSTLLPTNISSSSATLHGTVDPNLLSTSVSFEYGSTTSYGQNIQATINPLTGDAEINLSITLSGLAPNTTYHFRLKAENVLGITYGTDMTFKTLNFITDIDGFNYDIIVIGNQTWLADNLKTSRYRDGSVIPLIPSTYTWASCTTGAYSSYDNNNANVSIYGALYNWYAVVDSRGLCPAGWHVPTNEDWTVLTSYLGDLSVTGGKMKETGTDHWASPNTGADNSSGFTGIGAGFRDYTGYYYAIKELAYMWASTEYSPTHGVGRKLFYNTASTSFSGNLKQSGFSVRCIKD